MGKLVSAGAGKGEVNWGGAVDLSKIAPSHEEIKAAYDRGLYMGMWLGGGAVATGFFLYVRWMA